MAKTKQDIIDRLITALQDGKGDLDDLDKLMDKAKKDIIAAKEEEARKEKETLARGQKIADMATRVLSDKATEEDVAMVMEAYMHAIGFKDAKISAAEVLEAKEAADKAASSFGTIIDALGSIFGEDETKSTCKCKSVQSKKSADDVIADFLKNLK